MLYPIRFKGHSHKSRHVFVALLGIRTLALIWHFILGHLANDVVSKIIKAFDLPISSFNWKKSVCVIPANWEKVKSSASIHQQDKPPILQI